MNTKNKEILDVLTFRHACKKFDASKIISPTDFDTILASAQLSPTSYGLEPWNIIVLQDKDLRQKLSESAWGGQAALADASHFVVYLARKKQDMLFGSPYLDHMLKDIHHLPEETYNFYSTAYTNFGENDFKIFESDRATFDWCCKQAYIVMANMLTTAAYLGIDSCPIEGFVPAIAEEILGKEAKLYDQDHFGIAAMAGFGYRAEEPRHAKTRRPLSESILWK